MHRSFFFSIVTLLSYATLAQASQLPTHSNATQVSSDGAGQAKLSGELAASTAKNVHRRGHFDHSRHIFEKKRKGTVAFLGGSITEMNGYRIMVQDDLKARFPETDFTFINAGIGSTCSTTGAFRLETDVLRKTPDLLFVEFAVNDDQDAAHIERDCIRGMEGIIRHARSALPQLDIVVTHFVNPPMLKKLQSKETPISCGAHERVAAYYNVSSIDLATEVAERITSGDLTWKEYGGTHPKAPGNRIAADLISNLMDAVWAGELAAEPQSEHQRFKRPIDLFSYSSGQMLLPSAARFTDGWEVHCPDWDNLKGSKRDRFTRQDLICSSQPGSECELPFVGTGIGLYVLAGPDAGIIEFSIDGNVFQQQDLFHRFSRGLHYPRTIMLNADLKQGQHVVRIRVSELRNENSSGHAVRILSFAVNQ